MSEEKNELLEKWADYLAGNLSDRERESLDSRLQHDPELKKELDENARLWSQLSILDQPKYSDAMDTRFYQSINGQKEDKPGAYLVNLGTRNPWITGIAASLIGVLFGYVLFYQTKDIQLNQLTEDVATMREMLVLSLIVQPNAHDRIRAVKISQSMLSPEATIIEALSETLRNDQNVNVRLAALQTLLNYWEDPLARKSIISAIPFQSSPLVQAEIADAMMARHAQNSAPALKNLAEDPNTHELLREKLTTTVEQLESI